MKQLNNNKDNRCVANQRALLESGTLGAKGHVQVIVPHVTESYNSQRDPNDDDNSEIPYCTLKSFPSSIEHCIQWSRDKFESLFKQKPLFLDKFAREHAPAWPQLVAKLRGDENVVVDGNVKAAKIMRSHCSSVRECVRLARLKFEKYFANKAKDLMHAYPSGHLLKDGSPFWALPRRAPTPVRFDATQPLHVAFVVSFARLLAHTFAIPITGDDGDLDLNDAASVGAYLSSIESQVPEWKPVNKHIETDESKKKEEKEATSNSTLNNKKDLNNAQSAEIIECFVDKQQQQGVPTVRPIDFEKDDDTNGHVDFLLAVSNLRACMYSIEPADKLQVKRIAGKIVPAIATTTSCVAGFVAVELCKLVQGDWRLDKFRNLFLNIGISLFLLSEPGACRKSKIAADCYVSLWDKWTISGGSDTFTLRNFIDAVKLKYKLTVSGTYSSTHSYMNHFLVNYSTNKRMFVLLGVIYGSKPIYIPVMPGHAKRLNETMLKLTKGIAKMTPATVVEPYVDLFLTYAECDAEENRDQNNLCPPIRYFFK